MSKYFSQYGFIPIIIIICVLIVGGLGVVVISQTILKPSPSPSSSPVVEEELTTDSTEDSTLTQKPSPSPTKTPTASIAATSGFGTTKTGWSYTSTGGVDVVPSTRYDKQALFIDFIASTFSNIEYIYYNLNYDTDEEATIRGAEGTFYPSTEKIASRLDDGRVYLRREITLGTCSQGVCKYDKNPRNFRITVTTKYTGDSSKYTRTLTLKTI